MFDRSKFDPYAAHILDQFENAFPQEKIKSIDNSEDWYTPKDGHTYEGGWVLEWLCPTTTEEENWNMLLRCATETPDEYWIILRWGDDHEHFFNRGRVGEPEIEECLNRIVEIFTEKVWHLFVFWEGQQYGSGKICKPDEIPAIIKKQSHYGRVIRYEIKSWRGTFDQEVHIDDEG